MEGYEFRTVGFRIHAWNEEVAIKLISIWSELASLGQVIMIDLVLAGDNAIVVGMVAASMPKEVRGRIIMMGILAATILRVLLALITNQLLQIIGLTMAGGFLLLWVCWKFWRELEPQKAFNRRRMPRTCGLGRHAPGNRASQNNASGGIADHSRGRFDVSR